MQEPATFWTRSGGRFRDSKHLFPDISHQKPLVATKFLPDEFESPPQFAHYHMLLQPGQAVVLCSSCWVFVQIGLSSDLVQMARGRRGGRCRHMRRRMMRRELRANAQCAWRRPPAMRSGSSSAVTMRPAAPAMTSWWPSRTRTLPARSAAGPSQSSSQVLCPVTHATCPAVVAFLFIV